ncbi:MAG: hypothetical protein IRZ11_05025 [Clostridia bacterium]|nr:hypothetical protein [Clostridia bacterium]
MPTPTRPPSPLPDPDVPELTAERRDQILDWAVSFVDRWRMYTPAILLAEGFRPMNYILGQMAHFAAPYAHILGAGELGHEIGYILEDPRNIDYFIRRVEELGRADAEREAAERRARGRPWWWPFGRGPRGGTSGSGASAPSGAA